MLGAEDAEKPPTLTRRKTMSEAKISLEDRQEMYDTLARYVWSMDTGDIEGVVATITPDGTVRSLMQLPRSITCHLRFLA
jgi:hypothetical protein